MSEPLYWEIPGLSYEKRVNLIASDLIVHYQHDREKGTTKFWPASEGVLKYLRDNLPPGTPITGEEPKSQEEKRKLPPIIRRPQMGTEIPDD